MPLAPGELIPWVSLNILKCSGHDFIKRNYQVPTINSAKVQKSGCGWEVGTSQISLFKPRHPSAVTQSMSAAPCFSTQLLWSLLTSPPVEQHSSDCPSCLFLPTCSSFCSPVSLVLHQSAVSWRWLSPLQRLPSFLHKALCHYTALQVLRAGLFA